MGLQALWEGSEEAVGVEGLGVVVGGLRRFSGRGEDGRVCRVLGGMGRL